MWKSINIDIKGYNYCPIHKHKIDYELVNEIRPECIEENRGCGNCLSCVYISSLQIKKNGKEVFKKKRLNDSIFFKKGKE